MSVNVYELVTHFDIMYQTFSEFVLIVFPILSFIA